MKPLLAFLAAFFASCAGPQCCLWCDDDVEIRLSDPSDHLYHYDSTPEGYWLWEGNGQTLFCINGECSPVMQDNFCDAAPEDSFCQPGAEIVIPLGGSK